METFVVAPKASVIYGGRVYKKGQEIPGIPAIKRDEHLKSGFMVRRGSPEEASAQWAPPPCTVKPIPIGEDGTLGKDKPIEVEQPKSPAPPKEPEKKVEKVEVEDKGSVWTLDPDGIQGKSIEELNVMILERQPELQPFDTAEEAIAWLSKDYVEPVLKVS